MRCAHNQTFRHGMHLWTLSSAASQTKSVCANCDLPGRRFIKHTPSPKVGANRPNMISKHLTFFSVQLAKRLGALAFTPAALHCSPGIGIPKVLQVPNEEFRRVICPGPVLQSKESLRPLSDGSPLGSAVSALNSQRKKAFGLRKEWWLASFRASYLQNSVESRQHTSSINKISKQTRTPKQNQIKKKQKSHKKKPTHFNRKWEELARRPITALGRGICNPLVPLGVAASREDLGLQTKNVLVNVNRFGHAKTFFRCLYSPTWPFSPFATLKA